MRDPVIIHKRKTFSAKDRARIFAQHDGRCGLSGAKIDPGDAWEVEHRIALALGGTNDDANLYPALVDPHKEKTRSDVKAIAKCKRIVARENGTRRERPKIASRPFQKGKTTWPKRPFEKRWEK